MIYMEEPAVRVATKAGIECGLDGVNVWERERKIVRKKITIA